MDKKKQQESLNTQDIDSKIIEYIATRKDKIKNVSKIGSGEKSKSNFSEPKPLEEILAQRKIHRNWVLWCILGMSIASLLLLGGLATMQAYNRIYNGNYEIFEGNEFHLLTVGVFGEIFAVVWIITKELWDDTKYLPKMDL